MSKLGLILNILSTDYQHLFFSYKVSE